MYGLWVTWRQMRGGRGYFGITASFAMFGMILGVASLVVAMAVVSGYETTLKKSIVDVVGHVIVSKRGAAIGDVISFTEKIKTVVGSHLKMTPFVVVEAVLARKGQLSGVIVEGVERQTVAEVLKLEKRIIQGKFDLEVIHDIPGVLLGRGLVKRFDLKLGDEFKVVMPQSDPYDATQFRPRVRRFRLTGVLDLGRYDYDNRYIVADLKAAQELAEIGDQVMGVRLRLPEDDQARPVAAKLAEDLGFPYWTRDWTDLNRNLFEAIKWERWIIFLVISVMIIAAAFNVSSTLYFSVLKRFADISVLKTIGASQSFILRLFAQQGLIIGVVGSFLGLLLGLLACYAFSFAQGQWNILPAEVYTLTSIEVEVRGTDVLAVFAASLLICFLSTLAPALRGARLKPVEGLRYE
ncbi:MAG: ABC transporter permease [Pseudobdellovibrionaceae bacterium]|nr:MAG: ABC transporter permease [Pseudobdellovibrionaceae bacterium]